MVTISLPAAASVGDRIQVGDAGAGGGWVITQRSYQIIYFLSINTTSGTGGSIASVGNYNAVTLRCVIADTTWFVETATGNLVVT